MRARVVKSTLVAALVTVSLGLGGTGPREPKALTPLYECEAATLAILTPQVQAEIRKGSAVIVESEPSTVYNLSAYYVFRVVTDCDSPSCLVGHFLVNKYTADVLDISDNTLATPELRVVQQVLRKVHGMTKRDLERYREEPVSRRDMQAQP